MLRYQSVCWKVVFYCLLTAACNCLEGLVPPLRYARVSVRYLPVGVVYLVVSFYLIHIFAWVTIMYCTVSWLHYVPDVGTGSGLVKERWLYHYRWVFRSFITTQKWYFVLLVFRNAGVSILKMFRRVGSSYVSARISQNSVGLITSNVAPWSGPVLKQSEPGLPR